MTKTQRTAYAKPTAEATAKTKPSKSKGLSGGETILIVGLGNPGAKYAKNRHNIGFMAVEAIASAHGFGPWRAKFQGETSEGRVGGKRVTLLKPMTYMNESGQSVSAAARFLKVPSSDVIVIHDELDLAPGKCRVKMGGGHAGHNGLRSIHAHIGADYGRVRLGIGHPGHKDRVSGYVLNDFPKAESDMLSNLLDGISDGAPKLIAGDDAGFQNAVALRAAPPKPPSGNRAPYAARQAGKKPKAAAKKTAEIIAKASPTNPLAQLLAKFQK